MKTLMIQGTTSDAGKSTLVAGLCRLFSQQGMKVAPFKPQNMALNSAVTPEGGEIGRAQALQAQAARVPLHTDYNPVLLKPNSDTGAQVIIHGKAIRNMEAGTYHDYKKVALDAVLESHARLEQQFECVLVEGAGSPAEINLRENDIANMGFATEVNCPVIIIADIDKGGVFAHLVGTLALLSEHEQTLVKGFVINRFRGDIELLKSGLDWLEERTKKPVLGVLPYLHDLYLDAEDAICPSSHHQSRAEHFVKIRVLLVPHISNHTDFDALQLNPLVQLTFVRVGQTIDACDLVIIPGSKNVLADLKFLKAQGWQNQLERHLRYGGKVLGICGGMQMLGQKICDPLQIESTLREVDGLGLAEMTTELKAEKILTQVSAYCLLEQKNIAEPTLAKGYEIHAGISKGKALLSPLFEFKAHPKGWQFDGFISEDQQIAGTYIHGLFDQAETCRHILQWVAPELTQSQAIDLDSYREQQLDRLASECAQHLDIEQIKQIFLNSPAKMD